MAAFLLWCLLLVVCWPLALLALILYPIVWILLLPFRLIGITVTMQAISYSPPRTTFGWLSSNAILMFLAAI